MSKEYRTPTGEEIEQWHQDCCDATRNGKADHYWAFEVPEDYVHDLVRATLEKWGKPQNVDPVPLSERKPEEHRVSAWHTTDEVHDDAGGAGVKWQCPDCGDELVWASGMWWDLQCNCENRHWNFEVNITYVDSQPLTT